MKVRSGYENTKHRPITILIQFFTIKLELVSLSKIIIRMILNCLIFLKNIKAGQNMTFDRDKEYPNAFDSTYRFLRFFRFRVI